MADDFLEPSNGVDAREPILPVAPPELGIDPLLLSLLHCAAFLDLASEELVDPEAAGDVLESLELYIKRLPPERLSEIQYQLEKLEAYAEEAGWSDQLVEFVGDFLYSC